MTAVQSDATGATGTVLPLRQDTLLHHDSHLRVPTYDRSRLRRGVVHMSVGGFSRSHQLSYFDELAEQRLTDEWGVVGVGLHSSTMKEALAPQDYLYTVVERSGEQENARVVGALIDYHFAPDDPGAVLATLTEESVRLVTMTITGTGYLLDGDGEFQPDDDVRRDLEHPESPCTVFGFLVEALDRRRRTGLAPFTVLSCDNMQSNGKAIRTALLAFARLRDEVLARWIADNVSFPSSMVDRITPSTSPEERESVARTYGVDDRWPVITEPFTQWVVEDDFCNGRPPLDEVGVSFVPEVSRHELMKTRLLNAGHSALGYLGTLAGHATTDQVMADPVFSDYLAALMSREVAPMLPTPEGVDLAQYQRTLLERFANPAIGDGLDRLCRRGSTKMVNYLLPSLAQALAEGREHRLLTLAVAGWFRYLRGTDLDGRPIDVQDAHAEVLCERARAGGNDPRPLLGERWLFDGLVDDDQLIGVLHQALEEMQSDGIRDTIAAWTARSR
jgi:fructuronate reductase/mannitol 2-dehydrogenase